MQSILQYTNDFVLGDGSLVRHSNNTEHTTLQIAHSYKQQEYIEWKAAILQELNPKLRYSTDCITLTTKGLNILKSVYPLWYNNKRKILSSAYLKSMTAESIAIHYMDDGTKSMVTRYKIREYEYLYEEPFIKQIRLCLCNFTEEEVARYGAVLDIKFNISNRMYVLKGGNGYYPHIVISTTDAKQRFIELVQPYILPSLKYKIEGKASRQGIPFTKVLYKARNDYQSASFEDEGIV